MMFHCQEQGMRSYLVSCSHFLLFDALICYLVLLTDYVVGIFLQWLIWSRAQSFRKESPLEHSMSVVPSHVLAVHYGVVNWQNHCFTLLYVVIFRYCCMQLKFSTASVKSAIDFDVLWTHHTYAEWSQSNICVFCMCQMIES